MSVVIVNGVPGKGKTLNLTREAISQYKCANTIFHKIYRKIKHEPIIKNVIYSSYPILLDKKRQVYSHKVSIYDLTFANRFPKGSSIFIMEIQLCYDSEEYKLFPDIIAAFLQAHRHGGIRDIFFDSQSMSRIIKKMRIIACERWQVLWTFHLSRFIPFIPLGITCYKIRYDTEEEKTSDLSSQIVVKFFNSSRVSKAYDTTCLSALWNNSIDFDRGCYTGLKMDYYDIVRTYFRTNKYKLELSEKEVIEYGNDDKLE